MKNFSKLFEGIDQNKKKLGVQDYGVAITTLEEVFLRIANDGTIKVKLTFYLKFSSK